MKLQVVYASDTLIALFWEEKVNIVGQHLNSIFPNLNPKWTAVLQACLKGKGNPLGVQNFTDNEGNEKFYEWSNASWYDIDENIIGVIIQITNISAAIESDIVLEKASILLKQQSELSKTGIWEFDLQKQSLHWCSMTKAIHEVPLDFIPDINTAIDFYKKGYCRNTISMAVFEATDTGKPWNLKLQVVTAKGNEKWVMASGKPLFENGKITRLIGTFQDINEQVVSEMKMKEDAKLLKTLIDHPP